MPHLRCCYRSSAAVPGRNFMQHQEIVSKAAVAGRIPAYRLIFYNSEGRFLQQKTTSRHANRVCLPVI
ncbi:hypothetical protein AB833_10340 [Chromatiales bacterium (ex Bugula neritina AB1)]|nr:hypothetical protein AB833_10340 [Chromatiales bacterium (ex Bugula neritina AB1)]